MCLQTRLGETRIGRSGIGFQIQTTISIKGEPAPDLFPNLLEMEVEEDHHLADVFRIRLAILQQPGEEPWLFLDDERIRLWNTVKISVTLSEEEEVELIDGYITQIKPHIDPDESKCSVEIWGMDASVLMSLEEKIKDWPKKKDSDIAEKIFKSYSLAVDSDTVENTEIVHDDKVATIIQRETDIQFLKRLAQRNGYECYVKGKTGYFRKPILDKNKKQPVLAAHFGEETNLMKFDAKLNAQRPISRVEMHQIDTIGKKIDDAEITKTSHDQLGRDGALSISPPNSIQSRLFMKHAVATGKPEMKRFCEAIFDEAQWLIAANGEIDSVAYGAVLQAKNLVPIKGVGETFSGLYYVTSVKHVFNTERYVQRFTARRNALAPSGPEDFAENGGSLPF